MTPGSLVYVECSELEPQPSYTLGSSWESDAVVTSELMVNSTCGDTSYFLITVSDDMGHFASGEQQIIINDTTAPEILFEEEVTIACGETPSPQYDVVDNCAAVEVVIDELIVPDCIDSYEVIYTILAVDVCGNENVATQVMSVVDSIAPVFGNCPDSIFFNTDMATIDMLDLSENSNFEISDNCAEDIAFDQSIAPGTTLEVGSYPIEFTLMDNCGNVGTCQSIVVVSTSVGLFENDLETLSIYPNPADERFYLTLDVSSDGHSLLIYDLDGRLVLQHGLIQANETRYSVPVQDLHSGSYVVELLNSQGNVIGRTVFVKE